MSAYLSPVWGAGAQLFTNQGVVLAGGLIYTYVAGSTTAQATWADINQVTANPNPIVLDSAGRPPQQIYLDTSVNYKFVLQDSTGATIATYDNITIYTSTGSSGPLTATTITTTGNVAFGTGLTAYGMTVGGTSYFAGLATMASSLSISVSLGVGTSASGTAGDIRATGNVTAYYSDKRLKKDITPISDALSRVGVLQGVLYKSNAMAASYGYDNPNWQTGVLAQDVALALPQAVFPAPFDIGQNEDGTEYSKSGEDYMTVKYELLVPLLIEAVKELTARVAYLEGDK